jgi:hypothetical protein
MSLQAVTPKHVFISWHKRTSAHKITLLPQQSYAHPAARTYNTAHAAQEAVEAICAEDSGGI